MYIVTGGAGFIGSACVWMLNRAGADDIVVVDNLGTSEKWKNLVNLKYCDYINKNRFLDILYRGGFFGRVKCIIHMGACSSTTERDADYLYENNTAYSQRLCEYAINNGIRFIYASSAATYGDGERGFDDDMDALDGLRPMNMYGYSKHLFDLWAKRKGYPSKIVGLKFFNVFGPNEYHKGDMQSVVRKAFFQIREKGVLNLFRSHRPDYRDGEQKRDFVYVKDCCQVIRQLIEHPEVNGLFNVGSAMASTWNELAKAVFKAMNLPFNVNYIDMPESIRDRYQYFTQASMKRLEQAGCSVDSTPLEEAVGDYVLGYLAKDDPYLRP